MARRERTTGLPRPRRREQVTHGRTVLGVPINERTGRFAILSAAGALLLAVFVVFAATIYHDRIGHGKEVILRVDGDSYTLNYYADRLLQFAKENPGAELGVDTALLNRLEEEALLVALARERGVDLSKAVVDAQIAQDLGVPAVGGSGTAFDRAYRENLKTTKLSDSSFRRLETAKTAEVKLRELLTREIGTTGEAMRLRAVITNTKEAADDVVRRVTEQAADLGTIAQTESADIAARQQDGLLEPQPPALLPEAVRKALEGVNSAQLLGPIQVEDRYWVFRLESRDPSYVYTDLQKSDLASIRLQEALKAKRATAVIKRTADSGDIAWATKHAGK